MLVLVPHTPHPQEPKQTMYVCMWCDRGAEKGVMVGPVLADLTHDGTPDILMSAFEGVLVLYDGETLQEMWRHHFPGMESYR